MSELLSKIALILDYNWRDIDPEGVTDGKKNWEYFSEKADEIQKIINDNGYKLEKIA